MFAVEPYSAEHQEYGADGAGGLKSTWKPCRVVGITKDVGGDPAYIIEITNGQESYLQVVGYIRRKE